MNKPARSYAYFEDDFVALAHRGGYLEPSDAARENSLYAFSCAVDAGYNYVETDVHITADQHLIAFHDGVLDRVTDASGIVARSSFSKVRAARIAGIDQIPTLDEVLESFPETRINIDIKAPGAAVELARVLRAHRAEHRVCVTSFSWRRLQQFRKLVPDVATGMATPSVVAAVLAPFPAHSIALEGQVFQIPVSKKVAGRKIPVLTEKLMDIAHQHHQKVHVWTVNDPAEMSELIDLGVDGIVSDRIDLLREVAKEHGVWAH